MAKDLPAYAKQRDASAGQDKWAKFKMWKDPMGGVTDPRMGNSRRTGAAYNKSTMKPVKGFGGDAVDNFYDKTYGKLNKPSDSTV